MWACVCTTRNERQVNRGMWRTGGFTGALGAAADLQFALCSGCAQCDEVGHGFIIFLEFLQVQEVRGRDEEKHRAGNGREYAWLS